MIWNHTRAYGYDDDMTKKTSGKTEEKNRVEEHIIPPPVKPKKAASESSADLLSKEIVRSGMNASKLATITGVHEGTISNWLAGKMPASATTQFKKVCRILRIKPGDLLAGAVVEDESVPKNIALPTEEKARLLLGDEDIGNSFRQIVESLFEKHFSNDSG